MSCAGGTDLGRFANDMMMAPSRHTAPAIMNGVIQTPGSVAPGVKACSTRGGEITAEVTLTQLSFGFQWGGQTYSEFIFFKDDVALADFMRGNYELGAQVSAVAVTSALGRKRTVRFSNSQVLERPLSVRADNLN